MRAFHQPCQSASSKTVSAKKKYLSDPAREAGATTHDRGRARSCAVRRSETRSQCTGARDLAAPSAGPSLLLPCGPGLVRRDTAASLTTSWRIHRPHICRRERHKNPIVWWPPPPPCTNVRLAWHRMHASEAAPTRRPRQRQQSGLAGWFTRDRPALIAWSPSASSSFLF